MLKNFLQYPPLRLSNVIKIANAVFVTAMLFCCFGCGNTNTDTSDKSTVAIQQKNKTPLTFLDSVEAQMKLSSKQILRHTIIDSAFLKNAWGDTTAFTGDTVYKISPDRAIVILSYSDHRVCSEKFLLIYNTKNIVKNTAYELIETNCDEDVSASYGVMNYKIVNPNLFYVKDIYIERLKKKDKVTVTQNFFKVTEKGLIKKISEKNILIKLIDKDEFVDDPNYH
ncbi:hypothetical protein ACFGVR_20720 [Mucilaginibacter sp. AW1-3]